MFFIDKMILSALTIENDFYLRIHESKLYKRVLNVFKRSFLFLNISNLLYLNLPLAGLEPARMFSSGPSCLRVYQVPPQRRFLRIK